MESQDTRAAPGGGAAAAGEPGGQVTQDAEDIGGGVLLSALMTPEQLGHLAEMNDQVLGLLTEDQRQRMDGGENIYMVMDDLDPGKLEQIDQLAQGVLSSLNKQQVFDLQFLGSGVLDGINLNTRMAILERLKGSNGEITSQDLIDVGIYPPGASDGFLGIGGPTAFKKILEKEYGLLRDFGISFAFIDQQSRMLQGVQQTLLFASVAAPLIDNMVFGPALQPKFENNPFDNLERYGTQGNFKGSQVPWTPPESAGVMWGSTDDLIKNDILGNPKSAFTIRDTKNFGKVLDVRLPGGTGARWSADGKTLIMFLEKDTPLK